MCNFNQTYDYWFRDGYHTPQPPIDSLQAMDLNQANQQQQQQGVGGDHGGVLDDHSFESNGEERGGREEARGVSNGGDQGNVWYDTDL